MESREVFHYAKFSEIRPSCHFQNSGVTILLAFVLFSLFFIKDQIDSFQLKQIVVFLKCSVCVFYISL